MAKFVVVGLQSYHFEDENGRPIKGNTIYYMDKSNSDSYRGLKIGKIKIPDGLVKDFNVLPGLYDLEFSISVGSGGKSVATICGAELISEVNIEARHK